VNISFDKFSCGGNDFIILDARAGMPDVAPERLATAICHRTLGVGADGLIFVLRDAQHPFRMQLVNADGSPAEVSYNGCRCLGRYAELRSMASGSFTFASDAGSIAIETIDDSVRLSVPDPIIDNPALSMETPFGTTSALAVTAGVPWLVVQVDDLHAAEIPQWSFSQRLNPFYARGTNVAIVSNIAGSKAKARFFERGVDEETMSSGSGSVSVATFLALRYSSTSPVTVDCAGGSFPVEFERTDTSVCNVHAAAKVLHICSGTYLFDN